MVERAPSIPQLPVANIDLSDHSSLVKLTEVLASAFKVVPMNIAFICDDDQVPPPYPSPALDTQKFYSHFEEKVKKIATANATCIQAGDWSAVAIWEPPGYIDPRAVSAQDPPRPLFQEWRALLKIVKLKYLADPTQTRSSNEPIYGQDGPGSTEVRLRPYHHLGFLARNPNLPPVPGAITAVIEPFLRRARIERLPVWLEASNTYAVKVYEHFGFRLVETVTAGVGKFGSDGWPKVGGEGVSGYAMIYDGHLTN